MFKTKRKRAVVLALIAFFCTAAVTYVAVDWKRFGGGFLAFFKGSHDSPVAASHGGSSGSKAGRMAAGDSSHSNGPALPRLAAATSRKHAGGLTGGANGGKSDDDLFKYGDPAAGIAPGSFVVAQNDAPGGGNGGGFPSVDAPAAPETSGSPAAGGEGGGGVTSPAPAPAGTNSGSGESGLPGTGKTPTPAPPAATPPSASPPAATPPAATPPAASPPADTPPAPAPTQSGTTDDPGTPVPPIDSPPPPSTSLPPVSAVPEASSLAMMSLGALFLAVAAARKRKQG